jgi:undecaprenyl-diphosphatase
LIEFDAALTRFVRSLNDFHIDHLHNPWLAELSDIGNQIGKGETLLAVSAVLLAAGYALGFPLFTRAGWETLLAHFVAGGLNTGLKHLVGRGRPKFMHTGNSEFVPFGGSGWDSFPSGHAMAAFAVTTVLAVRFPKTRWVVILMAVAVSISRLFRASHFLTDIVVGAVCGVLIGAVVAHPWKDWRTSFSSALMIVTPPLAVLLAVMTTIGQRPSVRPVAGLWTQGGLIMVVAGMIAYGLLRIRRSLFPMYFTRMAAVAVMGLGIAMCAESLLVATVILLVWLAHWLEREVRAQTSEPGSHPAWPYEAAFGLALLLTLFTMIELRGVLPIG